MEAIKFSDNQKEIITGVMLGDGYMYKTGSSAGFEIEQAVHHKHWIIQLQGLLGLQKSKLETRYKKATNGKKGNKTLCYRVRKVNKAFNPMWEDFYLPKRTFENLYGYFGTQNKTHAKTIPPDLILTSTVLYHWYCGDGTLKGKRPVFCTQGFPLPELKKLIPKFKEIGIDIKLIKDPGDSHIGGISGYEIVVKLKSSDKFFELIGPCVTPGFEHKWRN